MCVAGEGFLAGSPCPPSERKFFYDKTTGKLVPPLKAATTAVVVPVSRVKVKKQRKRKGGKELSAEELSLVDPAEPRGVNVLGYNVQKVLQRRRGSTPFGQATEPFLQRTWESGVSVR